MNPEERNGLVRFCIMARADIEGIDIVDIDPSEFNSMSDDELKKEADWLDDLLSK